MRLFLRLLPHYAFIRPRKGWNIARTYLRDLSVSAFHSRRLTSPWPSTIVVRITSRCNLRCVQCGQWGENGYEKGRDLHVENELTYEDYTRLFDASQGKATHVYFFGGEPFVRSDLLDLIRYASGKHFTVQITTNGTFLARHAKELVLADADAVSVSLDGPEDINNAIRIGAKNSFALATSGAAALLEERRKLGRAVPVVSVVTTITADNQGHLFETYEIARDLGVDVFHIQYGIFTTEALVEESFSRYEKSFGTAGPEQWKGFIRDTSPIDPEVVVEQVGRIRADLRQSRPGILYRETPAFRFDTDEYFRSPEKLVNKKRCTVPWRMVQVMPNGDLVMCIDWLNMNLGNVRDDGPSRLWNGDLAQAFRKHLSTEGVLPICSRCDTHCETKGKVGVFFADMIGRS